MTTFVTIDPGKKGGLVILQMEEKPYGNGLPYHIVDCRKMINDYQALYAFFREMQIRYSPHGTLYGIIEQVHSMPKQGVVSAFTFGQGYGALLMAMVATGFIVYQITPQQWMKDLKLKRPKEMSKLEWKKKLKDIAKQEFRNQDPTLETADALLIANWVLQKELKGERPWLQSSL